MSNEANNHNFGVFLENETVGDLLFNKLGLVEISVIHQENLDIVEYSNDILCDMVITCMVYSDGRTFIISVKSKDITINTDTEDSDLLEGEYSDLENCIIDKLMTYYKCDTEDEFIELLEENGIVDFDYEEEEEEEEDCEEIDYSNYEYEEYLIGVYGVFRKDGGMQSILSDCEYIKTISLPEFALYGKDCEYPIAVKTNKIVDKIVVEVYRVPYEVMAIIDKSEGIDPSDPGKQGEYLYMREKLGYSDIWMYYNPSEKDLINAGYERIPMESELYPDDKTAPDLMDWIKYVNASGIIQWGESVDDSDVAPFECEEFIEPEDMRDVADLPETPIDNEFPFDTLSADESAIITEQYEIYLRDLESQSIDTYAPGSIDDNKMFIAWKNSSDPTILKAISIIKDKRK